MSNAKTRTKNHSEVQRAIQGDCGAAESAARVEVQDVAAALYIHPFMLSRWRKEAREGRIVTKGVQIEKDTAAELKELRRMKKQYERLKLEHEILKKAIAFTSDRRRKSSSSSTRTGKASRSE